MSAVEVVEDNVSVTCCCAEATETILVVVEPEFAIIFVTTESFSKVV